MRKKAVYALCAIMLLAFALRFYHIGYENLWSDEFYSLQTAMQGSDAELIRKLDTYEINPPLYFIMLRHWMQLFGQSEFSARFPSLVFGMLNIVLIYLIGKELSEKAGLIAALLMAVSVAHIEFSQEARAYSMFTFLFLASVLLFARLIRRQKASHFLWIAAINALGLLTHYMMVYLVFLENCVVLLFLHRKKKLARKWLLSQIITLVIFLPWLWGFAAQMAKWMVKWRGTLIGEFGLPESVGKLGALVFAIPLIAALVVLAVLLVAVRTKRIDLLKAARKIRVSGRAFRTLFVLFIIAILIAYIAMLPKLIVPFFLNKFSLAFTAFLYLFIAYGATRIKDKRVSAICLAAIVLASLFGISVYHSVGRKEQIKASLEYVEQRIANGEAVLLCEGDLWYSIDYYTDIKNEKYYLYTPQNESKRREGFLKVKPKIENKTVWYVETHCKKAFGNYTSWLNEMYSRREKFAFKGVEVYHYT